MAAATLGDSARTAWAAVPKLWKSLPMASPTALCSESASKTAVHSGELTYGTSAAAGEESERTSAAIAAATKCREAFSLTMPAKAASTAWQSCTPVPSHTDTASPGRTSAGSGLQGGKPAAAAAPSPAAVVVEVAVVEGAPGKEA